MLILLRTVGSNRNRIFPSHFGSLTCSTSVLHCMKLLKLNFFGSCPFSVIKDTDPAYTLTKIIPKLTQASLLFNIIRFVWYRQYRSGRVWNGSMDYGNSKSTKIIHNLHTYKSNPQVVCVYTNILNLLFISFSLTITYISCVADYFC